MGQCVTIRKLTITWELERPVNLVPISFLGSSRILLVSRSLFLVPSKSFWFPVVIIVAVVLKWAATGNQKASRKPGFSPPLTSHDMNYSSTTADFIIGFSLLNTFQFRPTPLMTSAFVPVACCLHVFRMCAFG